MDKVLMSAKGYAAQLELLENKVRIVRQGVNAFLLHGAKGDKEIFLRQISSIQFKKAGSFTRGYIQFGFSGSDEAKGGILAATTDENTVLFDAKDQAAFEQIKAAIEDRLVCQRGEHRATASLDELEKLASLRDRGIVTEEEFIATKKQLLGVMDVPPTERQTICLEEKQTIRPDETLTLCPEEKARLEAEARVRRESTAKQNRQFLVRYFGVVGILTVIMLAVRTGKNDTPKASFQAKPKVAQAATITTDGLKATGTKIRSTRNTRAAAGRRGQPRLGISRHEAVALLSQDGAEFSFEESLLANGTPRYLGKSPAGFAVVELTGSPRDLTQISVTTFMPKDNPAAAMTNLVYIFAPLKRCAPSARKWVMSRITAIGNTKGDFKATRSFGKRRVSFQTVRALGCISVTIESVP